MPTNSLAGQIKPKRAEWSTAQKEKNILIYIPFLNLKENNVRLYEHQMSFL